MSNLIFLQSYSFYGGGVFGGILSSWEQMGVFDYMIPFLLIFAIVYGLLTQLKIFGKVDTSSGDKKKIVDSTGRVVNAIIALAVGLLSLRFNFMAGFFAELFPKVGIGLIILLLAIIFTGLFVDYKSKAMMYTMYGLGAVILIVILASTSRDWGFLNLAIFGYNWVNFLPWIALIVLLVVIINAGKEKRITEQPNTLLSKLLSEGG